MCHEDRRRGKTIGLHDDGARGHADLIDHEAGAILPGCETDLEWRLLGRARLSEGREGDGQPLDTLSGSGKAVANLAIRIGLGQALTNNVMSLFMADEIDAAIDDERATSTGECLQNPTKVIKQILLVSHKTPDADHYIDLGAVE